MDFMLEHVSMLLKTLIFYQIICLQTHYKESKIYLEKYQNCLIQALNMIKNYTISSLENSTKNILSRKVSRKLKLVFSKLQSNLLKYKFQNLENL